MKSSARPYRMTARAAAAEETGRRIVAAMQALFGEVPYAQLTLEMVAQRAEVTQQTVIRRFGSKDGLLVAAAADARARITAQRAQAPAGDVAAAVGGLFDHYEAWGRVSLKLLEQEAQISEIAVLTREGRATHAAWVERVFAEALGGRPEGPREQLRSQLVAVTDVYIWKILRVDRGLTRDAAQEAVLGLVRALVPPAAAR